MKNIGAITGNDPVGYTRFATFLGAKPAYALLAFNQNSPADLWASVSYICGQAKLFIAAGAQIIWSVPTPGAGQLEAIFSGTWSKQYLSLFQAIVAASPLDGSSIFIRLPWEFNLAGQQTAARDVNGKWNAGLFVDAWRILATLAYAVSPRVKLIWCPNVTTQGLDPLTCWPGVNYVDIIAQDFYMQKAWNKPGDFNWFLTEARGLAWAVGFAKTKGKLFGLSEWGMDDDRFVPDFEKTVAWLNGLGGTLHHHDWWDRPDGGIDCRISDATIHPGLSAAYKVAFGG